MLGTGFIDGFFLEEFEGHNGVVISL